VSLINRGGHLHYVLLVRRSSLSHVQVLWQTYSFEKVVLPSVPALCRRCVGDAFERGICGRCETPPEMVAATSLLPDLGTDWNLFFQAVFFSPFGPTTPLMRMVINILG